MQECNRQQRMQSSNDRNHSRFQAYSNWVYFTADNFSAPIQGPFACICIKTFCMHIYLHIYIYILSEPAGIQFFQQLLNQWNHEKHKMSAFKPCTWLNYFTTLGSVAHACLHTDSCNSCTKYYVNKTCIRIKCDAQTVKMVHSNYNTTLYVRGTIPPKTSNKITGVNFHFPPLQHHLCSTLLNHTHAYNSASGTYNPNI